jgi:hypothetical protein
VQAKTSDTIEFNITEGTNHCEKDGINRQKLQSEKVCCPSKKKKFETNLSSRL